MNKTFFLLITVIILTVLFLVVFPVVTLLSQCASGGDRTWQCRVALAPLGSDAVVPAGVGVLDEAAQVVEELGEGHVAGLVDGVVEQGGPPQRGVPPEQHAVDAGQALLRGVGGLQVVLPAPVAVAPRLVAVVEAAEVMCSWWGESGGVESLQAELVGFIHRYFIF